MRMPMDPGPFADLMPEGSKMYMPSKLPTVEYKKDTVEYEVADLTLLHRGGVKAFLDIMAYAANDEDAETVQFSIPEGMPDEDVEVIEDIVMGVSFSAKKKGKNGWSVQGKYLVVGCSIETGYGHKVITFELDKRAVKSLNRYLDKNREEPISYYRVIEHYIDDLRDCISETEVGA